MVGLARLSSDTNMSIVNTGTIPPNNSFTSLYLAEIGTRIECADDYGTIQYIGEVQGHKGSWFGVDWDNPARGKHDGTVDGVQYFKASHPTSGSFIRPKKVNLGRSAAFSIQNRYGTPEDEITEKLNHQKLLCVQKNINAPFIEMVGFEQVHIKQRDFSNLTVVSLREQYVNGSGDLSEVSLLCPNIEELDLSKNLLNDWTVVLSICQPLQHLHWLNVSENILTIPKDLSNYKLSNLKTIICGGMRLVWLDVITLAQLWPNIEEMRVQFNNIDSLNAEIDLRHHFPNLKFLDLEGNPIGSWLEIAKLGVLSYLEVLIVTNTNLKVINFPDTTTELFPSLKHLVISENLIDNWESISELNKLPKLDELKFIKNPILERESKETSFQLIVARMENLQVLNGTKVKPEERKGAEYDYLKKYGLEWLKTSSNAEVRKAFIAKHPRYPQLVAKYGALEESELITQTTSLKSNLIEVTIIHLNNQKKITKKLPPNMLVQKLKTMIQRLFNIDYCPRLTYISSNEADFEVELDNDYKDLRFYSIQTGDHIYINS